MQLSITQLFFTLMATKKIILPDHSGSTIRGAFGHALRKLSCNVKNIDCSECTLYQMCAYAQLFNPYLTKEDKKETSNRFHNKPRPIIFEADNIGNNYNPGQELCFKINVLGKAKKFLPYIIESWRLLENVGIGSNRGNFKLLDIWKIDDIKGDAKRIYNCKNSLVYNLDIKTDMNNIKTTIDLYNNNNLKLFFSTPVLLKYQGNYVKKIKFNILMMNLFRRLSSLSYFYGEEKLDIDFNKYLTSAGNIEIIEDDTDWIQWFRYSNRQNQKINMSGLIGQIIYEGNLEDFFKYLIWGQYIHVGKNTVFGQGKYIIL